MTRANLGWIKLCLCVALGCGGSASFVQAASTTTPLDDYVAAADSSYSYTVSSAAGAGFTTYTVDMTSQTWRTAAEITPNAWQHRMTICVPDNVTSDIALLHLGEGSSPSYTIPASSDLALLTGSVVATLPMVPNQPLQFAGESAPRSEDSLLAKSFANHLATGDPEWNILLPMVKSAVRAMDTVQAVASSQNVTVNDFVVAGASKRGWATWLTAAVDPRVTAIAPAVSNFLNLDAQMDSHRDRYEGVTAGMAGGYSTAIYDYVAEGVIAALPTPEGQDMLNVIDPYEYRDRLDMPKYMVNATGDEFSIPGSGDEFLGDMPGDNYIRYIPNVGHGLNEGAINAIGMFYAATVADASLPEFSWTFEADGTIRLVCTDMPMVVRLWQATNPDSADFRDAFTTITWTESIVAGQAGGVYLGQVAQPASGSTAYMLEMTYFVGGMPMMFTTEVNMVPEPTTMLLLCALAPLVIRKRR